MLWEPYQLDISWDSSPMADSLGPRWVPVGSPKVWPVGILRLSELWNEILLQAAWHRSAGDGAGAKGRLKNQLRLPQNCCTSFKGQDMYQQNPTNIYIYIYLFIVILK